MVALVSMLVLGIPLILSVTSYHDNSFPPDSKPIE